MSTVSELRVWLDQGDVQACEKALRELPAMPDVVVDLLDWVDCGLYAVRLGHRDVAMRMVALSKEQSARFTHDEDGSLDMIELEQLLGLCEEVPGRHQQAIAAYLLGEDAALSALMEQDAKACAATHAVLLQEAPLLVAFFAEREASQLHVQEPNHLGAARIDRALLGLGLAGVVFAITLLMLLVRYGSSWAGPSMQPYAERVAPRVAATPAPSTSPEVTHQSEATFELRLALLRARSCVCERTLDACAAITAFDRSQAPSCALLDDAELIDALTACNNDEAREALSRACPSTH